jgi:cytidylate kinase
MAVITITREMATGGRKLGRLLSKRLDYQYVDKSLFQKVAEDLKVSEKTLESFEKSREYNISNTFAKAFSTSYIERIVGYDKSVVEEEEYQKSLRNLILETAREDNVVIIGRAAYFFLRDMKNMLWKTTKYAGIASRGLLKREIEICIGSADQFAGRDLTTRFGFT